VGICVCIFAYISKTDKQVYTILVALVLGTRKLVQKGRRSECVLISILGESVLCNSETKHDRRWVPRQKFFVPTTKLQDKIHNSGNLSLAPLPVKMFLQLGNFVRNVNATRNRIVSFGGRFQVQWPQIQICPGFETR
jgi:hypothetical protein